MFRLRQVFTLLFAMLANFSAGPALAEDAGKSVMKFVADPKLQENADVLAKEAIRFAHESSKIELDWSDASIRQVDVILGRYHHDLPAMKKDDQRIQLFAKMFGSYVGEVFRRNHGASWGKVSMGGQDVPGLQSEKNAYLF